MKHNVLASQQQQQQATKSLQSCPTLCNPIDSSPPGSPVSGILQARTLEWVAISFSNAWKWKVKSESEVAQSCPTLSDPMDCSLPGSSSMGFSRQEYWSGVPLPSLKIYVVKIKKKNRGKWHCHFSIMTSVIFYFNFIVLISLYPYHSIW